MIEGANFMDVAEKMGIVALISLAFVAIGAFIFRWE